METHTSNTLVDPSEPATLAWLHRVSQRFSHPPVEPEDVVTDVLIRTKCEPQPRGLYCQMIKHMAINHSRTLKRRCHLPLECAMQIVDTVTEAERNAVHDRLFIESIKPYLRDDEMGIFQEMAEGNAIREVADMLCVGAGGLRTKIGRTRGRMNREMGNDIDAPWGARGRR